MAPVVDTTVAFSPVVVVIVVTGGAVVTLGHPGGTLGMHLVFFVFLFLGVFFPLRVSVLVLVWFISVLSLAVVVPVLVVRVPVRLLALVSRRVRCVSVLSVGAVVSVLVIRVPVRLLVLVSGHVLFVSVPSLVAVGPVLVLRVPVRLLVLVSGWVWFVSVPRVPVGLLVFVLASSIRHSGVIGQVHTGCGGHVRGDGHVGCRESVLFVGRASTKLTKHKRTTTSSGNKFILLVTSGVASKELHTIFL